MSIVTRSTTPLSNGERLFDYYSQLPRTPGFSPVKLTQRAARGLKVLTDLAARRPAARQMPTPLNPRAPGSGQSAFFDLLDESDPASLPDWHPDSPHYAGD